MDVRFINPFIVSARSVFEMMVHLPLELRKPHLRAPGSPYHMVSAVVGIGGAVTGCVVLGFSQQVALALVAGMTNAPCTALDDDCIDALGEIVNMIAGAAKMELPGGLSTLAVPSVVIGSHKIQYPTGVPVMVIPCHTKVGELAIELAIRPAVNPPANAPAPPADAADAQVSGSADPPQAPPVPPVPHPRN